MYPSVRNYARKFLATFEGFVRQMYLDQYGFVTVGIGNLIDPINRVHEFKWVKIGPGGSDGPPASRQNIEDEWRRVKCKWEWKGIGAGHFVKKGKTAKPPILTLQIAEGEINRTFLPKLERMEQIMKATPGGYFKDYETFPADAQLAILTHIWAFGPNKLDVKYPELCKLCKARNWGKIASKKEYHWKNMLPSRDHALKNLYLNAENMEVAKKSGFNCDFSQLQYPILFFSPGEVTVRHG